MAERYLYRVACFVRTQGSIGDFRKTWLPGSSPVPAFEMLPGKPFTRAWGEPNNKPLKEMLLGVVERFQNLEFCGMDEVVFVAVKTD